MSSARPGENGMKVRAYVSTVFGCPYEGEVAPEASLHLAKTLRDMGVYQISLSDTIGVANPAQVERILELVLAEVPLDYVAVHFHDTQGTALANLPGIAGPRRNDHRPPPSAASAVAPTLPARLEIWLPRTSYPCCTAWGWRPASTSPR